MKQAIKIRGITVKQGSRFVRVSALGVRGPAGTGGGGGGSNIASDITFTPAGTVAATNVQAAIAEVASERVTADTSLATSITAEASSRTAADASLTTALSAEVSLTVSRDASLATAISSGDSSLTAALSTAISTEASTRTVADASLTTRFGALGYFATGTDAANLSGQIALARFPTSTGLQVLRANAGNTALEFATISAGGGDMLKSDNLSGLTNVATARTNLGLGTAALSATGDFAPASLSSTVSTADASLTTRLGTEESTRGTADSSLTTRISTEESTRGTAVTSLATAIAGVSGGTQLTDGEVTTGTATAARTTSAAQLKLAARTHTGQRGFKAHNNASASAFSVTQTTWTKLTSAILNTEAWDSDGWWDSANARFQPTVAGWYLLVGGAVFENLDDQARYVIGVMINGVTPGGTGNNTPYLARAAQSGATNSTGGSGAVLAYFNGSTDYAEMTVFHGSAGAKNLGGGAGWQGYQHFSAILIRSDS